MENMWLVVLAMGAVTYVPRMIPMVLMGGRELPPSFKAFFKYIPYAALGALIFPGVLSSTGDLSTAAIGAVIAVILSILRMNVIVVVFGSILGVLAAGMIF